jgi:nicotinamide-nucleotide amidase
MPLSKRYQKWPKAQSEELKAAFAEHWEETKEQIGRLKNIFKMLDSKAEGKECPALKGLIQETEALLSDAKNPAVLDARLIGCAQAIDTMDGALRTSKLGPSSWQWTRPPDFLKRPSTKRSQPTRSSANLPWAGPTRRRKERRERAVCDLKAEAERLVGLAKSRKLTLLTVESCTAGALACALANAEGAGDVLHGGFVVYTKENKCAAVGVSVELIRQHTAVSAAVAKAMAVGGLERSPAHIARAITGVAGPEPDEDGNPVGLTFVAAAGRDGRVLEQRLDLSGSKVEICQQAMSAALQLAQRLMT